MRNEVHDPIEIYRDSFLSINKQDAMELKLSLTKFDMQILKVICGLPSLNTDRVKR